MLRQIRPKRTGGKRQEHRCLTPARRTCHATPFLDASQKKPLLLSSIAGSPFSIACAQSLCGWNGRFARKVTLEIPNSSVSGVCAEGPPAAASVSLPHPSACAACAKLNLPVLRISTTGTSHRTAASTLSWRAECATEDFEKTG